MSKLNIRVNSWLANNLSWAYVCQDLINAFDDLGHNTLVISTNGLNEKAFKDPNKMIRSILELQQYGSAKKQIDIDWCYTVPPNLPQRFLPNSKNKCVIYNYETHYWPKNWSKYYHLADYFFPSSNFSAEIFALNGVPKEKIFVIPHGVDINVFNSSITPIKLKTNKKFKFVSVVAPHARKNIDTMLKAYCQAFTAQDDVCLVLKTKLYKHSDGKWDAKTNPNGYKPFEIIIGDFFRDLYKKYGSNMPEIEVIGGHIENVSSLYNACDCHISTTSSEGFFLPGLESLSCGLINIAPRYSGHLDFLNDNNGLLIDTKLRYAKTSEQYWGFDPRSKIGQPDLNHTVELMRKVVKEYDHLKEKFGPHMKEAAKQFSWTSAAKKMIDATQGKIEPYRTGSTEIWK